MSEFSLNERSIAIVEIDEFQRLRGWIVNSYAQIEFMLGDLILRCRQFAPYSHLAQTLPHDATQRVKRIRSICLMEGPLSGFAAQIEDVVARFEARRETRNLMSHGFATYHVTPEGESGLNFQKWHRMPDRIDARLIRTFRLREMESEQALSIDLAQTGLELFQRIHSEMGWVEAVS